MRLLLRKQPLVFGLPMMLVLLFSFSCLGITPGEVFENGRRAFILGNWLEAREQFSKFNEAWPTHTLAPQSLYFRTLADVRLERELDVSLTREKIASLSLIAKALSDRLPEADLKEIHTEIEYFQGRINSLPATPTFTLEMSPDQLNHALNRGWWPFPTKNPMSTLQWIRTWMEKHPKNVPTPLMGRLELLRAKALWEFILSPLPTSAFMGTLKLKGDWPLTEALYRSLTAALEKGDPTTKREAALLGVSSESLFSSKELQHELHTKPGPWKSKSKWMGYLQDHGINVSEAWCPK